MSFTTMVLFGENAASPHGVPGDTKLKKNQFVLFDLGTMHEGYASDVTRTFFFGEEPPRTKNESTSWCWLPMMKPWLQSIPESKLVIWML